jgi:enterochelin esterase-like enzyme
MFELGSINTEILFFLLTFGLCFFTIIFWGEFSKAHWGSVLARTSLILLIQVMSVSSVGIAINRSGEFYSNWNDLLGKQTNLEKVAISPNLLTQISVKDIATSRHTDGGSLIIKKIIKGERSNISSTVYVVLPPKIATLFEATISNPDIGNDYQVVELFSGYPGVPETWIGSMQGIKTIETLQTSGGIKNTIAIIPTMNVDPQKDTECLNFTNGPQVETWLSSDMKSFAQRFLGIDDRPWATFGYSTGGWCAMSIAIRHHGQYSRAVSLSGYFKPLFSTKISSTEKNILLKKYDLLRTLNSTTANIKMLIIAGKQDSFAWTSAQQFISKLSPSISVRLIPIPSGGHNTKSWIPYEDPAFRWIDQNS